MKSGVQGGRDAACRWPERASDPGHVPAPRTPRVHRAHEPPRSLPPVACLGLVNGPEPAWSYYADEDAGRPAIPDKSP